MNSPRIALEMMTTPSVRSSRHLPAEPYGAIFGGTRFQPHALQFGMLLKKSENFAPKIVRRKRNQGRFQFVSGADNRMHQEQHRRGVVNDIRKSRGDHGQDGRRLEIQPLVREPLHGVFCSPRICPRRQLARFWLNRSGRR